MRNVITTNYFTTFLQIIVVAKFYQFLSSPTTNIIFSLINNHLTHQQFGKKKCCKIDYNSHFPK